MTDVLLLKHRPPRDGVLTALDVRAEHSVLLVGRDVELLAGLLAELVGCEGLVTAVESDCELVESARRGLRRHYGHVTVLAGDGTAGAPRFAPFDRILATSPVDEFQASWFAQAAPGAVLVAPLIWNSTELTVRLKLRSR